MRSDWLVAVALVVLVVAAAFWPWIVHGKVLAPLDIVEEMFLPWRGEKLHPAVHNHFVTDAALQYVPYRMVMHQSIREDGYVGWNPLIFGGTAQHANTMLINHEVTMVLHRFFDFWPAWNLGRLLQFLFAGLGMLLFLRSIGSSPGVAAMGAVAYMLNHQFVVWIYFNQVVAAFCWMPWVLWALHKARDGKTGFAAAAAGFICFALLGATLQQAAFVVAVLGCLWAGWVLEKSDPWTAKVARTWIIALPALLGAGLAAFALEPTIAAYLENEQADHGRGGFGYDGGWAQPLWQVAASPMTVYPFLLGSVQSLDLWKAVKFDIFNVGFFGTLPMLLAVIAMFSRRVPVAAKLLMLAGVIVPLTPLVGFLYHRFNVVWILGGCWASAAWLNQARDAELARLAKMLGWVSGVCALLWLSLSVGLWLFRADVESWLQTKVISMASGSAYGLFTSWMKERASNLVHYFYVWNPWQMLALGGFLLSVWGLTRIRSAEWSRYAAALGVALQLSVVWWQWTTWSEPGSPYGNSQLEKTLLQRMEGIGRLAMRQKPWAEYVAPPNTLMPAGIAITGGYDAMHPWGMESPSGREWDFPATTHYLGRSDEESPEGWDVMWGQGDWQLWENPKPSSGILFTKEGPVPLNMPAVERPTFNTMQVTVPAGASGVEIFCNWHRGWEWRMDTEDKWRQTNVGDNRTIRIDFDGVTKEESTVHLRYNPAPPLWALSMSLISFAAVLAIAFYSAIFKGGLYTKSSAL
jgi:hypothetical protein